MSADYVNRVIDSIIVYKELGKIEPEFFAFGIKFQDDENILKLSILSSCCDYGFFVIHDGPKILNRLIGHSIMQFYECFPVRCIEECQYNYNTTYNEEEHTGCKEDTCYVFKLDNGDNIHILHRHFSNGYYHGSVGFDWLPPQDQLQLEQYICCIYDKPVTTPSDDILEVEI